jgi:hypothetical protein
MEEDELSWHGAHMRGGHTKFWLEDLGVARRTVLKCILKK